MIKGKILLITTLTLLMFTTGFSQEMKNEKAVIKSVDKDAFRYAVESGLYTIIDVRTEEEYNKGHIGNAKKIDFTTDEFDKAISNIDKSIKYLIYCQSGGRSTAALKKMQAAGFMHVLELEGGYQNWIK